MNKQMNAPKENLMSKIGDKFKKVAVGAALLGTLNACDANGSADNQAYETDFNPKIEQNDASLVSCKYRADYAYTLKSPEEVDAVFNDFLTAEEREIKEKIEKKIENNELGKVVFYDFLTAEEGEIKTKIDDRELVKKEFLRLKSLLGKEIYHVKIERYLHSYSIYCNSKQEYDEIIKEYNIETKDQLVTEEGALYQKKAIPMGVVTLTEEKLVEIIKEYATDPSIMGFETCGIWQELLKRKEE